MRMEHAKHGAFCVAVAGAPLIGVNLGASALFTMSFEIGNNQNNW